MNTQAFPHAPAQRCACLLLLVFLASGLAGNKLAAQTPISGTVSDTKGLALPGANVFLEGTYDGTTSDTAGNFAFTAYDAGRFPLVVSFLGYEPWRDTVDLGGSPLYIEVRLKEEFNELNAVVISAGAFEASDEGKSVVFKPLDIVTTAGAAGDIFGALGTLPGAQQVGNEEGLFVRGGAGYETKTIIDGLTVQNPFFSQVPDVPSRGRFSPFLFKGTVFSSGGYSAQYGQALSSAIVLNTSDFPTGSASGLSLSPIFAGGFTQKVWEKTAFSVGVNYTNVALNNAVIPQRVDFTKPFEGLGGNLTFVQKTSQTGLFKVYATYSYGKTGIRFPNPVDSLPGFDFSLDNKNLYVNASWKEILGENWTILASASVSDNDDAILIAGVDNSRADRSGQGRIMLTNQLAQKIKLRFGGEYNYQRFVSRFGIFGLDQSFDAAVNEHYGAAFLESEFFLSKNLAGRLGLRSEYSKALDEVNWAPRASLAYKTGKNSQINLAYGQFYQTPRAQFIAFGQGDLTFERASHYIANWQWLTDKRTFRLEGYYKPYRDLVLQSPIDTLTGAITYSSDGDGYAGGVELFYRDKASINNGDFWISYSWIDTRRRFLDYPESVRPDFASEHLLSLVYKHYIPSLRSQLGITYSYQSPRPFHDPREDAFMTGRTPAWNNLSLNWSYLTNIRGHFTVLFASFGNILGFDQVFNYRYFDPNGAPVFNYAYNLPPDEVIEVPQVPPTRRSFFVGMFVSFQHADKPKNTAPPSQQPSDSEDQSQ